MHQTYESRNYNELISLGENDEIQYIHHTVIDTGTNDTDYVYEKIKENSDKYGVNVYAANIKKENNKKEITKYVYITDFSFFNDIKLENGVFFNEKNIESEYYLTTDQSDSEYKIGELSSFTDNTVLNLITLKSGLGDNPFNMEITFTDKKGNYDKMINSLKAYGIMCYDVSNNSDELAVADDKYFYYIVFFASLLMLLINIYDMFNDYKSIAVKRMIGYSYITLCMEKIRYISSSHISIFTIVLLSFKTILKIKNNSLTYDFFLHFLLICGIILALSVTSVFFVYLFGRKFSVSDIIKNNNNNTKILVVNMVFKVIITSMTLYFIFNVFQKYNCISEIYNNKYQKWKESCDLYCVNGISVSYENADTESDTAKQHSYNVYRELNEKGAVLCEFKEYSEEEISFYEKTHGKNKSFMFQENCINPNYLKENTILDDEGQKIDVSEDCEKITYLIPEKYKEYESGIYEVIKKWYDAEKEDVNIIWTANNQKVFTYNWYVKTENGCFIEDPVLCVYTLNNTDYKTFWYFCGAMNGPVKIKCADNSEVIDFYKILYKYFDDNIYSFNVYNFYDSVALNIERTEILLRYYVILSVCLFSIYIFIILQNIFIYFIDFEKEVAVYSLMGYGLINTHSGYLCQVIFTGIAVVLIELVIVHNIKAEIFFIMFILLELTGSIILLRNFGKRNTVALLKKT